MDPVLDKLYVDCKARFATYQVGLVNPFVFENRILSDRFGYDTAKQDGPQLPHVEFLEKLAKLETVAKNIGFPMSVDTEHVLRKYPDGQTWGFTHGCAELCDCGENHNAIYLRGDMVNSQILFTGAHELGHAISYQELPGLNSAWFNFSKAILGMGEVGEVMAEAFAWVYAQKELGLTVPQYPVVTYCVSATSGDARTLDAGFQLAQRMFNAAKKQKP